MTPNRAKLPGRHCSCEADAQPAADHAHQPKRIGCIGLAVMTLVYLLATAGLVDLIRLAWRAL